MRRRRWLRVVLAAMAVLLAASWVLSGALEYGWARRSLEARLSVNFGRPVEVGHFGFGLLAGPRLEADSVTIAEDPNFGGEYLMRAAQLAVNLRWSALLRGRLEFGTLVLTHPSLNLVRSADGHWNIESWLPPAKQGAVTASAPRGEAPLRLAHIEVNGGRINFKRGAEKLPFALVDVSGRVDRDSSSRWSLDLEARPMRVSVGLQNAGTLRLRGNVAGTSARLQPATLALTWEEASLADALRLARGSDVGVRGTLGAEFSVTMDNSQAGAAAWTMDGTLRLAEMHRWDLPKRATDPAINVSITAVWKPSERRLDLRRSVIESPHSRLTAAGELDWSHGLNPNLRLISSRIGLEDWSAWQHAFLPVVADDLRIEGTIGVDGEVAGWPPRIEQADVTSAGAVIRMGVLPGPIRIDRVHAAMGHGSLRLEPVTVSLPSVATHDAPATSQADTLQSNALRIAGSLGPFPRAHRPGEWAYELAVSGKTERANDLITLAAALGWKQPDAWSAEGPVALQLAWTGALRGMPSLRGAVDLSGLQLTSLVMNQPLNILSAKAEFQPGQRRITVAAAEALGARWKGFLDWRAANRSWAFDLSADQLDAAELDRWLDPGDRPSVLGRMLPFGASASATSPHAAAIARLSARGRLRIGEVDLVPLRIEKFAADAELDGRSLVLRRARGNFYGGHVSGDFDAKLAAEPAYTFRGEIDRVDLGALTTATAWLTRRFAGTGSGQFAFTAHGVGRENLLASLEGQGALHIREAVWRGFDPAPRAEVNSQEPDSGNENRFSSGTATFHVARSRVHLDQLLLEGRSEQWEVEGNMDFARRLDFRLQTVPRGGDALAADPDTERPTWIVAGTLDSPQVTRRSRVADSELPSRGARLR